jgi:hypothetical protein
MPGMNSEVIKVWLRKKKAWGFFQNEMIGAGALAGGILILFLTFWFAYAVIWFGTYGVSAAADLLFSKKLHVSHEIRLVGSGLFVVLLVIQHFRTDPNHWGDYPERNYVSSPALQMQGGAFLGMGFMLAYPGASANMVADILLVGPRLVTGGWGLMRKGFQMKKLDENGCAELLAFLCSQPKAAPYEDLKSAGWEPWFAQVCHIEGVQFLKSGLLLSDELRTELGFLSMT